MQGKFFAALCFFVLLFTGITIYVGYTVPRNDQLLTIFSGLLTGFAGALLLWLKHTESVTTSTDNKTPPTTTTTIEPK